MTGRTVGIISHNQPTGWVTDRLAVSACSAALAVSTRGIDSDGPGTGFRRCVIAFNVVQMFRSEV
jgi:hypothetical protein